MSTVDRKPLTVEKCDGLRVKRIERGGSEILVIGHLSLVMGKVFDPDIDIETTIEIGIVPFIHAPAIRPSPAVIIRLDRVIRAPASRRCQGFGTWL